LEETGEALGERGEPNESEQEQTLGQSKASRFLNWLFAVEKFHREFNPETTTGTKALNSVGTEPANTQFDYFRVAKDLLANFPGVVEVYDHNRGNILYAVCENGGRSIAETVIAALENQDSLNDFLEELDGRGRKSTTLEISEETSGWDETSHEFRFLAEGALRSFSLGPPTQVPHGSQPCISDWVSLNPLLWNEWLACHPLWPRFFPLLPLLPAACSLLDGCSCCAKPDGAAAQPSNPEI
jgi:hypothetical protein